MRTRVPSVGGLLRVVGLAGTLAGCLLTVASLSKTWAVDGPREGVAAPETGWQHIAYGDVILLAACVFVAILATALCVGPPSRRVTRTAGGAALTLLVGALAAVAIMYWMAGLDFSFFDSSDELRRFDAGPGYQDAATGLAVASLGMLVLLAGRWEARTRKALRREAAAAAAA
ncbi:MAG TPA: hypothetical protein VI318_26200, partial [Baekduia sp.]